MKIMTGTGILAATCFMLFATGFPQAALAQGTPAKQVTAVDLDKMKPSGTVTIDEEEIRLILGGARGKGVLNFKGKQYRFSVKGLSAGGIGIQKVHATGNVYMLNRIEDFPGKYTALVAGVDVVKGVGVGSFQNEKGVYVSLKEKGTGVALSLGIGLLELQLEK